MRPAHLPGVMTVAVTAMVTALGLLLAPSAPASAAAQSPAVQAAQALRLRAGVLHNNPVLCSGNLPVGDDQVIAAVCIGEVGSDTFLLDASIEDRYDFAIHADISLYFSPDQQKVASWIDERVESDQIVTFETDPTYHANYPVAGKGSISWDASHRKESGQRDIYSPAFYS